MIEIKDAQVKIMMNVSLLKSHWTKTRSDLRRIWLDESRLSWTPVVNRHSKEYSERSPYPLRLLTSPFRLRVPPNSHILGRADVERQTHKEQKVFQNRRIKNGKARRKACLEKGRSAATSGEEKEATVIPKSTCRAEPARRRMPNKSQSGRPSRKNESRKAAVREQCAFPSSDSDLSGKILQNL
ncbi:unnamed protein product [Gongylonema pulchrum]|uniref:Uncharacterized protein n=1 Tax=Gongylonema pulchrum TaxID=637853 RepID=A0A183D1A5_9BILA|nr:unnamed protein product [Gongylonema pulchrum]